MKNIEKRLPIPECLTVNQAAERLGVSRKTVYGWIANSVIESIAIGGRVLIPIEDLEKVIRDGRRSVNA
tara:strand:- start:127 stop:333 length:207 start_codon:yes stop_codon:yes gene_type:complete